MSRSSARSTPHRYNPKKIDVRITTSVVAYTSRRLGQVTRAISLRTSVRNRRARPHHPRTPSLARPPKESSCSAIALFISDRSLQLGPSQVWQDRRESNPQPPVLETGALPIELLSYSTEGLCPSDSPARSLARRFAGSLRSRSSLRCARSLASKL